MEIYEKIYASISKQSIDKERAQKLSFDACLALLDEILHELRNEETADIECFQWIEHLIAIYEKYNIDCENRHDFG